MATRPERGCSGVSFNSLLKSSILKQSSSSKSQVRMRSTFVILEKSFSESKMAALMPSFFNASNSWMQKVFLSMMESPTSDTTGIKEIILPVAGSSRLLSSSKSSPRSESSFKA
jgi:hypothetical protein